MSKQETKPITETKPFTETKKPFDLVGNIMAYEEGELGDNEVIDFFAELIKTGQCWTLQGCYGRMAKSLIDNKYIDAKGNVLKYPE